MLPADIAATIAAAVQQDLGMQLPLPAQVICTAYGWGERVRGDTRFTVSDIITERDMDPDAVSRKLAMGAAARLCHEAGYDHPPFELVVALAERLCGAALIAPIRHRHSTMRFAMGAR